MEVGAVKQAFNNELILLKKKLNQAKIQIIHKLTRKAKAFAEKKAPENIKEKFKRKAEAAVNEVLIIKKIKPKNLAKFIVTHKGVLSTYLNRPNVDQDKACARLLLHKSLQDKYKFIRNRFSSVPIEDLLMSREERKKQKKEAREKQKNKKKGKDNKVVNAEGDWDVEDVEMPAIKQSVEDGDTSNNEEDVSDIEQSDDDNDQSKLSNDESDDLEVCDDVNGVETDDAEENSEVEESGTNNGNVQTDDDDDDDDDDDESEGGGDSDSDGKVAISVGKFVKATPVKSVDKPQIVCPKKLDVKSISPKEVKKVEKKMKDKNKQDRNKNLNEKLLSRKFKKDVNETPVEETKVVDPFFITSTGENYMSVVEPRQPDEVKEEHKQGNRKLRRAVMFGHVPKIKPRRNDFAPDNRFSRNNNGFNKNDSFNKKDGFQTFNNSDKRNFTDKRSNFNRNPHGDSKPEKEEKLHPSWEAKKKQSGILPFQGKKIVFNEN